MKIGIAVRKNNVDYFIHQSYCNLLNKYNHIYAFININSNLNEYDGFLLPGGFDIDSKYYHEKCFACQNIDEEMDILDENIIEFAVKNKKPLLGICRGIQSINVFLNGSLKQNINNHQQENHFIVYKNKYHLVNSFHHQSVKDLGDNLCVLAKSLDGEIEIIAHNNLPIIGVQFHPELTNCKINNLILSIFNDS